VQEATFSALSVGGYVACGLLESGSISCWGGEDFGQARVPAALR
jgi:hypothetical protein